MKHSEFFRNKCVFTIDEFASYLSRRGDYGKRAAERFMAYYKSTGRVLQIRRGLYAVNSDERFSAAVRSVDPFLIASKLTKDAVLSHHTALEFYGYAYSVWHRFVYSSARPLIPVQFDNWVFRGTKIPASLLRTDMADYAVLTRERSGCDLRVTSLERTLVDLLDRPELGGGWEEIWLSLESVEFFDLAKIIAYTELLSNATIAAKVGFFLEQHRESLMVEQRYLGELKKMRPKQAHYFDRNNRGPCRYIPDWQLVVPVSVLERNWRETA